MAAFTESPYTDTFNRAREIAEDLNCKLNFDRKKARVMMLNYHGQGREFYCIIKQEKCPCSSAAADIAQAGICQAKVFER